MRARPYAFGDSEVASERMAIVAAAFGPTTRSLLSRITGPVARVLDLGPGPGYSTELLEATFPDAEIVAIEQSEAFAAQTRARVPAARVILGDVTEPLPPGHDVVYARFLLSHLADVPGTVASWCRAVAPGGALVLEEPEAIVSTDPLFARYETVVAGVVAATGADMYAGAALAGTPTPRGFRRAFDESVVPQITAGTAAAMFSRNARAWGPSADAVIPRPEREALVDALQRRVDDPALDVISWRLRQLVFQRGAAPRARSSRG